MKRIWCWLFGHVWGTKWLSLYTDYTCWHQTCQRCHQHRFTDRKEGGISDWMHGARTGRIDCSKPNRANVSRSKGDNFLIQQQEAAIFMNGLERRVRTLVENLGGRVSSEIVPDELTVIFDE